MKNSMQALLREEEAQGLVEYILIIAIVAVIAVVALKAFGKQISAWFSGASNSLDKEIKDANTGSGD